MVITMTFGEKLKEARKNTGFTQEFGKVLNTFDHQYYLVNEDSKQYFVLLTDEFMITRAMANRINEKKFKIENREFLVMGEVE